MNISLSPENEDFIQNQVAAGIYETFSEAVNILLNQAICGCKMSKEYLAKLNNEIETGIDAYKNGEYKDGDVVMENLLRKLEENETDNN